MKKRGKGKYRLRNIDKILRKNGYNLISTKKHYIYKKQTGEMISIPKNCKDSVLKTEFKKHNIKEDL